MLIRELSICKNLNAIVVKTTHVSTILMGVNAFADALHVARRRELTILSLYDSLAGYLQ